MTREESPWEDDWVKLRCPECDARESIGVEPALRIGADVTVTVDSIRCSECGYEGDNGEVDLD